MREPAKSTVDALGAGGGGPSGGHLACQGCGGALSLRMGLKALGDKCVGAFGNDQDFTDSVVAAGNEVGEKIWQLPTYDDYKDQYKSDIADIKNTGGRGAGSITGALIIGEFNDGASWVHLDIAGTARSSAIKGYDIKGATGVPVRTLVNLAKKLATT